MDKNALGGPLYYSKINSIAFYVLSNQEIFTDSMVIIKDKEIMKSDVPVIDGLYDPHMGTTDFAWNCHSCGNKKITCPGHFGSIELRYPVKSPMFRDELLKWLKIICFNCGNTVLKISQDLPVNKRFLWVMNKVKTTKRCEFCDEPHFQVSKDKKQPFIFYRHEELPDKKQPLMHIYYNHLIQQTLNKISEETVLSLGIPVRCHPANFILNRIPAPPNTIRPDIKRIGGNRSSNSDTTSLMKIIVEINNSLPLIIPEDNAISQTMHDAYCNLEITYYSMIKGGNTGEVKLITNTTKPPVSIAEHLPKKHGRFRRNLMGKRVEYMIRSVITGDSRLRIDEVGIPMIHARNLEVPETVTPMNKDRLMQYFLNGSDSYPGCKHIIKKIDGGTYRIDLLPKDYVLQIGDIIKRDMITGDYIAFNRQPSLLFSNIAGMKVVVMETGETLRINPSICNYFNADFDGDQMNSMVPQNIQSRNECMTISKVSRWFISPQNHSPLVGAFYDCLTGLSELTKHGLIFDKWHAMQMLSDISGDNIDFTFKEKTYNNRQLVSKLLPKINIYNKTSSFYKEQYSAFIKYNPEDIKVNIERGQLISGVIDKDIAGQEVAGSIFHIIANDYSNNVSIDTIYNLQQIVHKFLLYYGFTTGIHDINISEQARSKVKDKIAACITESRKITNRLNNGKLIAPIGMELKTFYETEQLNSLASGNDFSYPILADVDVENNGLLKMILSGGKGKLSNFIQINSCIGPQTIDGNRFLPQAGWGRTSPYFTRYDMEPNANGYVSTSYVEGITPEVYSFVAGETRHGLISNALKTSITGYQNRISIKNLESIIIDNLRKSSKNMNVVQPLYAESGIDPSKLEKIKFPTIMLDDKKLEENYHFYIQKSHHEFKSKTQLQKLLDDEYKQILQDRDLYREIQLTIEKNNPKEFIFDDSRQMPININRIIDNINFNNETLIENLSKSKKVLDVKTTLDSVKNLCDNLGYVYLNEIQQKKKSLIPVHFETATTFLKILIRSCLSYAQLYKKNIYNSTLELIIDKILITIKRSLIDPGTSVGIIAAQCISQPQTQYLLDSKHRTGGGGGTKTNEIVRLQEITGAKDTESIKNPHMIILVKDEYINDKLKVQEIANHIEMMHFERFISEVQILYENYKNPIHPKFIDEKKDFDYFEKHNYGVKIPNDLAKWCIRFKINKEMLIIKSMKMETIILAIRRTHPELYLMYTPENSDNVYIRCYIRSSIVKSTANYFENVLMPLMANIKKVIVRGVKNIISTSVVDIIKTVIDKDNAISQTKVHAIIADGTNTTDILSNDYINTYQTQSDSIEEIERIYGITAARHKIINEMITAMPGLNYIHCTIFADEMCYSGKVTNIQKTGLQKRENSNITLRVSFQTAIQVLQDAAIHGLVDQISGISGPLVVGTIPTIGTTYNQIVVDPNYIDKMKHKLKSIDEAL